MRSERRSVHRNLSLRTHRKKTAAWLLACESLQQLVHFGFERLTIKKRSAALLRFFVTLGDGDSPDFGGFGEAAKFYFEGDGGELVPE